MKEFQETTPLQIMGSRLASVAYVLFNPIATLITFFKAPKTTLNQVATAGSLTGTIIGAALFTGLFVFNPFTPVLSLTALGLSAAIAEIALPIIGFGMIWLCSTLGKIGAIKTWQNSAAGIEAAKSFSLGEGGQAPSATAMALALGGEQLIINGEYSIASDLPDDENLTSQITVDNLLQSSSYNDLLSGLTGSHSLDRSYTNHSLDSFDDLDSDKREQTAASPPLSRPTMTANVNRDSSAGIRTNSNDGYSSSGPRV